MVAEHIATPVWSDWAIPPGEFLAETLETLGMSQAELATRTDRPAQVVSEIVRGKKAITAETALELERALGVPAHIWLGLENDYQLTLARLRAREHLETEAPFLSEFPVAAMEKRGWIAKSSPKDKVGRVGALQDFFGVATLSAVIETKVVAHAALRLSANARPHQGALAAWLRRGYLEARDEMTESFDADRFEMALQQIRNLTTDPPESFVPEMKGLCARAGVALVMVPELPGTGANGCTRWLGRSKAMVQLNLRQRWSDVFWFTFFHEARHVLQKRVTEVFIDLRDRSDSPDELDADKFAADTLIPPRLWSEFLETPFNAESASVLAFARRVGVHPGIVVGRAQRDVWRRYDVLNNLRARYEWTASG